VTTRKYYIDKRCTIWVDQKMLKNPMKKQVFYQKIKFKKLGTLKNERVEKT
jgi:hypothetical protein